jgi:uncharacterized protein (TIGR02996 family)
MDEGSQLEQQIWSNPDDDLAAWIYADWLEEQGRPHQAEFLNVETRLRQLPADHPEVPQLLCRRSELSRFLPQGWVQRFSRCVDVNFWCPDIPPRWSAYVLYDGANSLRIQRQLRDYQSRVLNRSLAIVLSHRGPTAAQLSRLPAVADFDIVILKILEPDHPRVLAAVEALATTTQPVRWKGLVLEVSHLTAPLTRLLHHATAWHRLHHLELHTGQPDHATTPSEHWYDLFQAPWCRCLRGLSVIWVGHAGTSTEPQRLWEPLVQAGPFSTLRWFSFCAPSLSARFMHDLPTAFPHLCSLRCQYSSNGPSLNQFFALPLPLRFLELAFPTPQQSLWDRSTPAYTLIDSPPWTQLLVPPALFYFGISVHENFSVMRQLAELLQYCSWKSLHSLSLCATCTATDITSLSARTKCTNKVFAHLLETISRHPDLQQVRCLTLQADKMDPEISVPPVARSFRNCALSQLRSLTLANMAINAASLRCFTTQRFPALRSLNLQDCRLQEPLATCLHKLSDESLPPHIVWPATQL